MAKYRDSHRADIESILTEEQGRKFEKSPFRRGMGPMGKGFGHHGFGPMGGMHGNMGDMFDKMIEKREDFDIKLSSEEKAIIAKFKLDKVERIKEMMENGDFDKRRMPKREFGMDIGKKISPILAIADNHKKDLDEVFISVEEEMPIPDELRDCFLGNEKFQKMKRIRFLMMEF